MSRVFAGARENACPDGSGSFRNQRCSTSSCLGSICGLIPHHVMPLSEHRRDKVNLSNGVAVLNRSTRCNAFTLQQPSIPQASATAAYRTARLSRLHSAPGRLAGSIDSAIATASDGFDEAAGDLQCEGCGINHEMARADLRLLVGTTPSTVQLERPGNGSRRSAPSYSRLRQRCACAAAIAMTRPRSGHVHGLHLPATREPVPHSSAAVGAARSACRRAADVDTSRSDRPFREAATQLGGNLAGGLSSLLQLDPGVPARVP